MLTHLRAAEQLAAGLADHHRLGIHLPSSSQYALRHTQAYQSAVAYSQQAHAIATTLGDIGLQMESHLDMAWTYFDLGDYRRALDHLPQALTILQGAPARPVLRSGHRLVVHGQPCCSLRRTWMRRASVNWGHFAEGVAYGDEALPTRRGDRSSLRVPERLSACGVSAYTPGHPAQAVPMLEQAVALSQEADIPLLYRPAAPRLALAYALAGRVADALSSCSRLRETLSSMGRPISSPGK